MELKRIRITNASEKTIIMPDSLRGVIPYLKEQSDAIILVNDSQISTLRKLVGLGIVITGSDVSVIGGTPDDARLLRQQLETSNKELDELKAELKDKSVQLENEIKINSEAREEIQTLKKSLQDSEQEVADLRLELNKVKGIAKKYKEAASKKDEE